LLREIASAIRRGCRNQDFTARIGGDEFALILADCSVAGAVKAAQQVIDSIATVDFKWNGRSYDIGASVGVAPMGHLSPHVVELMRRADRACYAAKAAGRNRVAVYDPRRDDDRKLAESA
jgi:diguanylate cyclase (GGDEF)-like protein